MSQQGPGFTNPTQPRPGRSQSSQSTYGANSKADADQAVLVVAATTSLAEGTFACYWAAADGVTQISRLNS